MVRLNRAFFYISFFAVMSVPAILPAGTVQLPKTGQTKCHDTYGNEISCAGTGQDGEVQAGVVWPELRFTVTGDCVTDNLTGLMWSKDANPADVTRVWQDALEYAGSLDLCGYKDWRLPNANELESVINAGEEDTGLWLKKQGFTNVQSTDYWTSTSFADFIHGIWTINIYDGDTHGMKSSGNFVWPVRAGQSGDSDSRYPANIWKTGQTAVYVSGDDGDLQKGVAWPVPRFSVNGDCVTDNLTGLTWAKNANLPNGQKSWQGALDYVKDLNGGGGLCGYSDWKVPDKKELFSLVDHSQTDPALSQNHPFIYVQSNYYWTSTSRTASGWVIHMNNGYLGYRDKTGFNFVWPVRGASSGSPGTDCAATLSPDFALHIPVVTYNGQSYSADLQYSQGLDFTLTDATLLTDTSLFTNCASSTLSSDLMLHIPEIIYNGVSYWADLQYSQGLTFTLAGAGQN